MTRSPSRSRWLAALAVAFAFSLVTLNVSSNQAHAAPKIVSVGDIGVAVEAPATVKKSVSIKTEIDGVTVVIESDDPDIVYSKKKGWLGQAIDFIAGKLGGLLGGGGGGGGSTDNCNVNVTVKIEGGSQGGDVNVNMGNVTCGENNDSGDSSSGSGKTKK